MNSDWGLLRVRLGFSQQKVWFSQAGAERFLISLLLLCLWDVLHSAGLRKREACGRIFHRDVCMCASLCGGGCTV
jgi:hypothetical protein